MSFKRHLKSFIKQWAHQTPLITNSLAKIYQWGGLKPWSLGYSFYKFKYIDKILHTNLDIFKKKELPIDYGFSLDERVVEYPWFYIQLENSDKIILDAGSTLNQYQILKALDGRKIYLTTLAFEGINVLDPTPSYIYEDLRELSFKDAMFDTVVCISTLEHVGMDNTFYSSDQTKNESDQTAYLKVVNEFKRVLKKGGKLLITVPYGRYKNHQKFQIFDRGMVEKLIATFSPDRYTTDYFVYENGQWQFATKEDCEKYEEAYTNIQEQSKLAASRSVIALKLIK